MKYVIGLIKGGLYLPIVFAEECSHADAAFALECVKAEIIGAGFVMVDYKTKTIVVNGESESLKTKPGPLDDYILKYFLFEGLSGLDLQKLHLRRILDR